MHLHTGIPVHGFGLSANSLGFGGYGSAAGRGVLVGGYPAYGFPGYAYGLGMSPNSVGYGGYGAGMGGGGWGVPNYGLSWASGYGYNAPLVYERRLAATMWNQGMIAAAKNRTVTIFPIGPSQSIPLPPPTHDLSNRYYRRPAAVDADAFRSVPPQAQSGIERQDIEAYVLNAANTPGSEAAKNLGLQQNRLTPEQKQDLQSRVGGAVEKPEGFLGGLAGMFTGLFDLLATFVQCLVGTFTGECGFKDFGSLHGERTARHSAENVYESLSRKDASGVNYPQLAPSVSGVEPDGHGGYKPVQVNGHDTGVLARLAHPDAARQADDIDAGRRPSAEQLRRTNEMMHEGLKSLYLDPEVQARISYDRQHIQSHPGADDEAQRFVEYYKQRIEGIATQIITDPAIRAAGRYNYAAHRANLITSINNTVLSHHKELFNRYAARSIPSADALRTQLSGELLIGKGEEASAPTVAPSTPPKPKPSGNTRTTPSSPAPH